MTKNPLILIFKNTETLLRLFVSKLFLLFVVITFPLLSFAQLCQGSLGDPVVNITFETSSGQPLPFSLTNYTFTSSSCPDDGFYTITTATSGCFGGTWHTLPADHTEGDANGNMMLINASFAPGDFYIDTVKSLCSNTTYEFATWVVNVLKPFACNFNGNKPNLTFSIEKKDGTVIKTFNSGDIVADNEPQWKQYGSFFTTPPGTSDVVLRITNNAPGGCGNDLALDDITFRPCGPKVNAIINGGDNASLKEICEGNNADVTFTSNTSAGYTSPAYQWQVSTNNGVTWADIIGSVSTSVTIPFTASTPAGSYLYRLTVAEATNIFISTCRVVSNVLTVNINKTPVPAATGTSPVCAGTNIILTAANGAKYNWSGPANFTATTASVTIPAVTEINQGKYFVTATSDKGCIGKDSVNIIVNRVVNAEAGNDTTVCEGERVKLNAKGGPANTYMWAPATGLSDANIDNPIAKPTDTTHYVVTVTNQAGCSDTASTTVNILKKPKADAGPDKIITEGQSVQLEGKVEGGGVSYSWSPPVYINNPTLLQPVVNPPNDTAYILTVTSGIGCGEDRDRVFVRVYKKVIIPNAFSPNGDGINDTWNIIALDSYLEADLSVFNRYGQIVFQRRNSFRKQWDGTYRNKPLPIGTYYYVIDLKNNTPKLSGWVLIIR